MENMNTSIKKTSCKLVQQDLYLMPYENYIERRMENYRQLKCQIEKNEGSLYNFAKTYKLMGLVPNFETKEIYFKEYAPSAKSISIVRIFIYNSLVISIFGIEMNIYVPKILSDFLL